MNEIIIGSRVQTNRDLPNRLIKKGEFGTVIEVACCDSELYLTVKLDNGETVRNSCDNSWNLIAKNGMTRFSKLPFMFVRFNKDISVSKDNINCWVVIFSEPVFNYGSDDPLGEYKNCLIIPENSLEDKKAEHTFDTYEKACEFIKDWWKEYQ